MSWLFVIIPEFYNDVGNDMFYYFTLTNQPCHILYSRLQNLASYYVSFHPLCGSTDIQKP